MVVSLASIHRSSIFDGEPTLPHSLATEAGESTTPPSGGALMVQASANSPVANAPGRSPGHSDWVRGGHVTQTQ